MTKIADYLQQAVPDMVMSDTQDAYDQKYEAIQKQLKELGYDEVTEYFKDAWENAYHRFVTMMQMEKER